MSNTTSLTELGYVSGVTSAIQTQLGTKAAASNVAVQRATLANDFTVSSVYTTYADVTGLVVTVTTSVSNEVVEVGLAAIALPSTSTQSSVFIGLKVDSGAVTKMVTVTGVNGALVNISFATSLVITSPGSHTIQLQAARDAINYTIDKSTYSTACLTARTTGSA